MRQRRVRKHKWWRGEGGSSENGVRRNFFSSVLCIRTARPPLSHLWSPLDFPFFIKLFRFTTSTLPPGGRLPPAASTSSRSRNVLLCVCFFFVFVVKRRFSQLFPHPLHRHLHITRFSFHAAPPALSSFGSPPTVAPPFGMCH